MSQIDTVFKSIPAPLLRDWGHNVTYIKSGPTNTYVPTTGEIYNTTTRIPVRVVITQIKPEEFDGTYQTTDMKILLGNAELGTYSPAIHDLIEYTDNGKTRTGRIINTTTYRGENPLFHTLIVRPQ
jgi:hypothetical protein